MKYRALSVAFALLFASATLSISAEPKLPANIVVSFDKASKPSQKLQAKAPDWFHWQVIRASPDGKYVARLTVTDGEYANVVVYRRTDKKNVWAKRYAVSRNFDDVISYIWVPQHDHRLLVATGFEGQSGIVQWTDPNQTRFLLRGGKNNVADNFNIYGTSLDGRVLYYERFGAGTPDPNGSRDIVQTLRLPK